jgi:hypothetical protein
MIASRPKLTCPSCGNSSRFVEFMESEIHLIDGDLNYIRLLDCSVDYYRCWECDEIVELPSDESEE